MSNQQQICQNVNKIYVFTYNKCHSMVRFHGWRSRNPADNPTPIIGVSSLLMLAATQVEKKWCISLFLWIPKILESVRQSSGKS